MKTTTHYSREEVLTLSLPDTVLISIVGERDEFPWLRTEDWAASYRFRFDDVLPNGVSPRYQGKNPNVDPDYNAFNERAARNMAKVIRKHWDQSIHVHCMAGISRSAAVCEVLKALGWEYHIPPARYFGLAHANQHVVSMLKLEFPETFGLIGQ